MKNLAPAFYFKKLYRQGDNHVLFLDKYNVISYWLKTDHKILASFHERIDNDEKLS